MTSWRGAAEIIRYNWHFYAASGVILLALGTALQLRLIPLPLIVLAATPVLYWSVASVAASHYVYDCAAVTRWNWLVEKLPRSPLRWLNIHAGLDQSTPALRRFFPQSTGETLDIYDPHEMTEVSIARARQSTAARSLAAKSEALPVDTASRDCVFVLFAAHEIRSPAKRDAFFAEVARVLTPDGYAVVVEHLRDWRNFAAFGPAFMHFYPRTEWARTSSEGRLSIDSEGAITPFVRWFVLRKAVR